MRVAIAIALALASCDPLDEVKGGLYDVGTLLEPLCFKATCGQVLQCTLYAREAETVVEYCWRDDDTAELEAVLKTSIWSAACAPSPRGGSFGMPCLYSCPPPAHGCNAHNGCYCP